MIISRFIMYVLMSRVNLTVENLESIEGYTVNTISTIATCFCFYEIKIYYNHTDEIQ